MRKLVVSLSGAFAAAVVWGFPSAVTYVTDDQTVELAASTIDKSKVTDSGTSNKYGSYVYAKLSDDGSGTLKVTVPNGAKTAIMWSVLFVTNGVLTLDLTDVAKAGIPYYQRGGIVTRYPDATGKMCEGKLVVKGLSELLCGDPNNSYERFEIGEGSLSFQDADGNPVSDGKLTFGSSFVFVDAPDGMWRIASDAKTVSLAKPRGFDSLITTGAGGKKVLDFPYSLTLIDNDMVDPEATIRVAAVKTLNAYYSHYGTTLSETPNTTTSGAQGFFWSMNGYNAAEQVVSNDVELVAASSTVQAGLRVVTFAGAVSGPGRINIGTARNNDYCRTWFTKAVDVGSLTFNANASVHPTTSFDLRFFSAANVDDFDFSTTNVVATFESSGELDAVTGFADELPAEEEWKYPAVCAKGAGTVVRVGSISGYLRFVTEDGGTIMFRGSAFSSANPKGALLRDGKYVRLPQDFKVVVPEGESADVSALRGAPMEVDGKATIAASLWDEPTLWLDASAEGSVSNLWLDANVDGMGNPEKPQQSYRDAEGYVDDDHLPFRPTVTAQDGTTYYYVEQWNDRRSDQVGLYAYNDRHRFASDRGWWPSVYPIVVPGGLNGRSYVEMGAKASARGTIDNRRLTLKTRPSPKFAILVYGSQSGGGNAILANAGLDRGGPDDKVPSPAETALSWPITTNEYFKAGKVWLDGEAVDATRARLNGGWQIISIQLDAKFSIAGLGYCANNSKDSGGANYAEVMFFDSVPNDDQRVEAEYALAAKWGLVDGYKGSVPSTPVTAYGSGEIELDGVQARVGGAYSGKVTLKNGAVFDLTSARPIPTETDVAEIDGRTAWFDPDDEATVTYSTSATYSKCAVVVYDRSTQTNGAFVLAAGNGRAPSVETRTAGYGVTRRWLQFANVNPTETKSTCGNAMRLNTISELPHKYNQTVTPIPGTRTVFMVMDSSQGGGCPFLDKGVGGDKIVRFWNSEANKFCKDWTRPIWNSNAATTYFNAAVGGETYLNGQAVDGETEGFTGGPEVLTAVAGPEGGFGLGALGGYAYKDALTEAEPHTDVGEIEGEVMVFNKKLAEADRQQVEAYLMYKWLGMVPNGSPYAQTGNLTVSGDGLVKVADAAGLPSFDTDFVGTAIVTETAELAASIAADGAVTPVELPKVELPATAKLTVTFPTGRPERGWYTVVTAAGGLDRTAWTFDLPEKVKVAVSATEIKVKVSGGLLMLLR